MKIVVFDSGLGGLSILREVRSVLPTANIFYLADDAAFPYGAWQREKLVVRIIEVVSAAIDRHRPDLVVIACNTASTLALDQLRSKFDIPFVGTVPAIKPAAEQTSSGLISVLATQGTVSRQYTHDLIAKFASNAHVRLVGSQSLAKIAEAYLTGGSVDMEEVKRQIAPCFISDNGRQTDIVVLACTHYPFLINQFRKVAPWPVDWLDPAEPIARQAFRLIGSQMSSEKSQDHAIIDQATSQHSDRPGAISPARPLQGEQSDIAQFTSNNPPETTIRLVAGFGLRVMLI